MVAIASYAELIAYFALLLGLTPVLGIYLARVFLEQPVFLSRLVNPLERIIYRLSFIDPKEEMPWKKYAMSLVIFSLGGFISLFLLLIGQSLLPLNPQAFNNLSWALAFNTAISFVTNTNWQAYSGESTLSYFSQMVGLSVQNFLSAAAGMAVMLAFFRGLTRSKSKVIGNFWVDLVRSILYVLLPLSLILALLLVSQGVMQNWSPYITATTLEGDTQTIPMGPAASQIAIKQLGTNGGGYFGSNSAHTLENPTGLANFLQALAILLLPSALVYCFGLMTGARQHALLIYLLMLGLMLSSLTISWWSETLPNQSLGIIGSLEGKELRIGSNNSILWAIITTATSNGSVNAMLDSLSPLAGGLALVQILLGEVVFGGVGSGLYGMILFVMLTVFLAGLMVGRTPEYFGKKIEVIEIQMVLVGLILPSMVVLIGAGCSVVWPIALKSLNNSGPHGLTEMLYAWGSAANNNGSAFGGLNANTDYFNIGLGIAMLIGRFGVMIPVLAIAGSLASKASVPPSSATLATDTPVFFVLLLFVIIIIGALTFFPCLVLGPIVEHFLMLSGRQF